MGYATWRTDRSGRERYVIQWQDAAGKPRQETIPSVGLDGKPLARGTVERDGRVRIAAHELEVSRQRAGLAPPTSDILRRPLSCIWEFWWVNRGKSRNSPAIDAFVRKNLGDLLELPLGRVTPVVVGRRLAELEGTLAPKSRRHLRGYLFGAFELARKTGGPWAGRANPIAEVPAIKVPKVRRRIVEPEEMPALLAAMAADLQGPTAAALYAGLREGEIFGARKTDVDLAEGLIWVGNSWDRPRTKDGKALPVPIPPQLRPYLELALQSPGDLLFPDPRRQPPGQMYPRAFRIRSQLRSALVAAGFVDGFEWRCRAWGCGWSERRPSSTTPDACPKCGRPTTWARPLPRRVRFHDARHSYGTAMVRAAGLAVAQRSLRHSDVRLTADTYGHLELADVRAGVAGAFPVPAPGAAEKITAPSLRKVRKKGTRG